MVACVSVSVSYFYFFFVSLKYPFEHRQIEENMDTCWFYVCVEIRLLCTLNSDFHFFEFNSERDFLRTQVSL